MYTFYKKSLLTERLTMQTIWEPEGTKIVIMQKKTKNLIDLGPL